MTAVCFVMWPWHHSVRTPFPFSQCHRLPTENTLIPLHRTSDGGFHGSWITLRLVFGPVYPLIRLRTGLTCQTVVDSQSRRLPGRPLCSPCEHQCSRRGWVGPARPQRQHGPGAELASALQSHRKGDESHRPVNCRAWMSLLTEFGCQNERWGFVVPLTRKSVKCQITHAGGGPVIC